jgi:membrane-associated protease RseP (regulator of RpoE activity)
MHPPLPDSTRLRQNYPLHLLLFVATLFCTTWAGTFWLGNPASTEAGPESFLKELEPGFRFSLPLLAFLSVHEFGHYYAAIAHRIRATLPYYIPVPPLPFMLNIGTMGAVIKVRDPFPDQESLFDIGASGPLAGFAVGFCLLLFGFLNLPPAGYIYSIHPEYLGTGIPSIPPADTLVLGKNLLFVLLETLIAPKDLPPMTELYHYPFLFTGWLACLVTSLNLLPVGQLDGGHVIFAMFGRRGHDLTARGFLLLITLLGLPSFLVIIIGIVAPDFSDIIPEHLLQWSWPGWMLWVFILRRFIGTAHPSIGPSNGLSPGRRVAGWLCIAVFILTFIPVPFGIV